MLFMVWVCACWPFVWVMGVGVGVSGVWWRVFQCRVAVVSPSRRVPGVVLGFGVWVVCLGVVSLAVGACACVVGASVGVSWLVCVLWWFRMLTCSGLFLVCLFVWLVNNGVVVVWVGLVRWGYWVVVSCCSCLRAVNGVRACVCGVACASGCFW